MKKINIVLAVLVGLLMVAVIILAIPKNKIVIPIAMPSTGAEALKMMKGNTGILFGGTDASIMVIDFQKWVDSNESEAHMLINCADEIEIRTGSHKITIDSEDGILVDGINLIDKLEKLQAEVDALKG